MCDEVREDVVTPPKPDAPPEERLEAIERGMTQLQERVPQHDKALARKYDNLAQRLDEERREGQQADAQMRERLEVVAIGDEALTLAGVSLFVWGVASQALAVMLF